MTTPKAMCLNKSTWIHFNTATIHIYTHWGSKSYVGLIALHIYIPAWLWIHNRITYIHLLHKGMRLSNCPIIVVYKQTDCVSQETKNYHQHTNRHARQTVRSHLTNILANGISNFPNYLKLCFLIDQRQLEKVLHKGLRWQQSIEVNTTLSATENKTHTLNDTLK